MVVHVLVATDGSDPSLIAARQASLGDEHPNTLVAANNLACYLRCIGRLPEALTLTDDTLGRMQRNLGESHPLALSCAVNLANCRLRQRSLDEIQHAWTRDLRSECCAHNVFGCS